VPLRNSQGAKNINPMALRANTNTSVGTWFTKVWIITPVSTKASSESKMSAAPVYKPWRAVDGWFKLGLRDVIVVYTKRRALQG